MAESNADFNKIVWRVVESQRDVATMPLVHNDLNDQFRLEQIIETAKPPFPGELDVDWQKMHYLLSTPFRYPADNLGRRFCRPGTRGVFYGASSQRTAMAGAGYHQYRFLAASGALSDEPLIVRRTIFQTRVQGKAIDLRLPPFSDTASAWQSNLFDERARQLGDAVRRSDVDIIIYESVRDPNHGECVAVFKPRAFCLPNAAPEAEDWILVMQRGRVTFVKDNQRIAFEFSED